MCVCARWRERDVYMYKRQAAFIVYFTVPACWYTKNNNFFEEYILYICLKSYTFLLTSI